MQSLENFTHFYQKLDSASLKELHNIYSTNVLFIDPVSRISGINNLTQYFENLLKTTEQCDFDIHDASWLDDQHAVLEWTMHFASHQLKGGKTLHLDGISKLKFEGGKVVYQRDYYDLGAMLYEHIPLLGRLITWLKHRLEK